MLENFRYVNHLGESFSNEDGVRIEKSDLRSYKWEYDEKNNGIRRFRREISSVSVPITLMVISDDALEVRNKIFEVAEKDVLANIPGKIYIGEYYLSGFVIESQKKGYLRTSYLMQNNIKFLALNRGWIKETVKAFPAQSYDTPVIKTPAYEEEVEVLGQELQGGVLYPEFMFDYVKRTRIKKVYPEFDFPFDFVSTKTARHMENDSFVPSDFKLVVHGFAQNPEIIINGHVYGVNTTLYDGERIEIDSYAKTITKIGRFGEETNLFNSRMKEQSVFEKIPSGMLSIIWSEAFPIELTLYDERSEPLWS